MRRPCARLIVVVSAAVGATLVSGCTMGANYSRPAVPTPAEYRFVQTAQAESMADLPWWEIFDDPVLHGLIRESIAANLDLRAAIARVEEARARAGIAKSFLYPQVNFSGNYGARLATNGEQQGTTDEDTAHQNGNYGFHFSWEIDLFGRIRRQREAAVAVALA